MKKFLLAACMAAQLYMPLAHSQNYRDEIIEHAIRPCYLEIVNRDIQTYRELGMDTEQVTDFLMITQAQTVDDTVASFLPLVRGQDLATRKALYKIGLAQCLRGSSQ